MRTGFVDDQPALRVPAGKVWVMGDNRRIGESLDSRVYGPVDLRDAAGPAAGVVGARAVCERLGLKDAIAFDMGGTTAKAGVVYDGQVMMAGNIMVGGYEEGLPIQIPLIDIQEVGT